MSQKDEKQYEAAAEAMESAQLEEALKVINFILGLLTLPKAPEASGVDSALADDPAFRRLHSCILDLRELAGALNRGDLQKLIYGRGYVLSNLKALQSNLRHLTWQTQKIAEGDFTQTVDFLGEFSQSFNAMTEKLKDSTHRLDRLAYYDVLTQVPNRMSLEKFLEEAFAQAQTAGTHFSVLLFDIDFFKVVNDTYGHGVGDKVLIDISAILSRQFRSSDMFARYGGEEFMAVLPNMNIDQAYKTALRAIRAVASEPFAVAADAFMPLTLSSGLSEYREGDGGYADIIARSDRALYQAKRNGRNTVCFL